MSSGISNSIPVVLQAALIALVVGAALADLKTRHIPNWLPLSGLIGGIVLNGYHYAMPGVASALLGALLGAAIFIGLHLAGGMGAGDVKLFAAVGSIVGPQSLLVIFVLTGILGGVAALVLILLRGSLARVLRNSIGLVSASARFNWSEVRNRSDRRVSGALSLPYGPVVATSTLIFLFAMRN